MSAEQKTQDDAQSEDAGSDDEIKQSSDQPAEGEPNEPTGEGVSSEAPAEG